MSTNTPIFYTISNDFVPYAAVSLQSLISYASPHRDYQVIFIHEDLTAQSKAILASLVPDHIQVDFYQIGPDLLEGIDNRPENFLRADFYTPAIFYRLFIANLFPQFDRALYIDADTVWADCPDKLLDTPLDDYLMAAAPDHSIEHVAPMLAYIKGSIGVLPADYINSGVLVLNLAQMRTIKFQEQLLSLIDQYHFDCIAPDQDYLNGLGQGKIKYLAEINNAMPKDWQYVDEMVANPRLVHYNLFYKPWHFDQVMYEDYFWRAAKLTPFYEQLLQQRTQYSEQARQSDHEKLDRLMDKAGKLALVEPSFRTILHNK